MTKWKKYSQAAKVKNKKNHLDLSWGHLSERGHEYEGGHLSETSHE